MLLPYNFPDLQSNVDVSPVFPEHTLRTSAVGFSILCSFTDLPESLDFEFLEYKDCFWNAFGTSKNENNNNK